MEMEMGMPENGDEMIEIPGTQPIINYRALFKEWKDCLKGADTTNRYERKRLIRKVPKLLLKGEKGHINREYYEPAVVSLGPYHHNRTELAQAETYKLITLNEFQLSSGKPISLLYNKVFEVVDEARKCYIDGSTDDFNDEVFNRMMTLDGCFILFFIECLSRGLADKVVLTLEFLGALGFANVVRDIFLLENQIPFVVLEALLDLRFPEDKGEEILNKFFNYLKYGELFKWRDIKVLENKQPLHLLELYRSYFISFSAAEIRASLGPGSTKSSKWHIWATEAGVDNVVKLYESFPSIKELKSKGIFLKPGNVVSSHEDIKFHSHGYYSELKLVRRAVDENSKAIYLNMIAYEMCPHNPNDFRVSTYIRIMKSLVVHPDDVRELRNNNVLVHSLSGDEEVVKMYADIEAPEVNFYFYHLRKGIGKHCSSKYKTGWAEVFDVYFSTPWKTIASLAAVSILLITALQTYFTINPLPKASD